MNITIIFTILATFSVHASVIAQRFSLHVNEKNLRSVLGEIQKKTGYDFLYNDRILEGAGLVSVQLDNKTLNEVLDRVLDKQALTYKIDESTVLIWRDQEKLKNRRQERTLSGSVKNEKGEPLSAVTVQAEGDTRKQTLTDDNGDFKLRIDSDVKVIVFNSVGYKQQKLSVGPSSMVSVVMETEIGNLDEVVVVGYGVQKKKDISGSITTVKSAEFNPGYFTDVNQLIQGKVPGLVVSKVGGDPNKQTTVRLRGVNSLTGATAPLYVIDGVVGADINMVSPHEIESFDVLKDAATASIYGARAANGVIIITTKKGNAGQKEVTYSGGVGLETLANYLKLISGDGIRAYQKSIGNTDFEDYGGNTDWFKAITRRAWSQDHALSLAGGSENTSYRGSVYYLDKQGIVLGSSLERISGRFNIQHRVLDNRLKMYMDINANQDVNDYLGEDNDYEVVFRYAINANPTQPIYNKDGDFNRFYGIDNSNVVSLLHDLTSQNRSNKMRGTLGSVLTVAKGLDLTLTGTYESKNDNYGYFAPSYSVIGLQNLGEAVARRSYSQQRAKQFETYANYTLDFANRHHVDAAAGYSYSYFQNEGFGASGQKFVSDDFGYDNIDLSENADKKEIASFRNANALSRVFSRFNYNYANRYYVTVGFTREGSTRFGENNRYGNFPSVSAAWRISDERFMGDISWLDDFKFKASYGLSGTLPSDEHNLEYLSSYSSEGNYGLVNGEFLPVYKPARNANPDLKWETQKALNVGFDFSMFHHRLQGSVELYKNKIENLLYQYVVPVPPNVYSTTYANVGSMQNKGIDIQLSTVLVDKKSFKYNLDIVAAVTKNKVLSISNDIYSVSNGYLETAQVYGDGNLGYTQRIVPGKSIGSFYLYEYAGLNDEGRYLFYNKDGAAVTTDQVSAADKKFVGQAGVPPYQLGLNHAFKYKRLGLNLFFNGQFGNSILNGTYQTLSYVSRLPSRPVPADFLEKGITQTDPYISSLWLESGSFLRLQNASLSYAFDMTKYNRYIKGCRVSLTGENLFVITKYNGIDPEVGQDINSIGIDNRGSYPKSRVFMFNLSLNF